MSAPRGGELPGASTQRTSLSWSRTTLSLLANAGLVVVREPLGRPFGPVLAVAAALLAVCCAVFARRRSRVLAGPPAALRPAALEVAVLGLGTGALALAVGCVVAFG